MTEEKKTRGAVFWDHLIAALARERVRVVPATHLMDLIPAPGDRRPSWVRATCTCGWYTKSGPMDEVTRAWADHKETKIRD